MSQIWIPTPLERKCLSHLDEPANWAILRRDRPDERALLNWTPFWRIWLINFVQYVLILALLFVGLESTVVSRFSEVASDLPIGTATVVLIASLLAGYVTHLYRRSWNRRARFLSSDRQAT